MNFDFEIFQKIQGVDFLDDELLLVVDQISLLLPQLLLVGVRLLLLLLDVVEPAAALAQWLRKLVQQEHQLVQRDPPCCFRIIISPEFDELLYLVTRHDAHVFVLGLLETLDDGCDGQVHDKHGDDYCERYEVWKREERAAAFICTSVASNEAEGLYGQALLILPF